MLLINITEKKDPSQTVPDNESDSSKNRDIEHKKIEIQKERIHISELADKLSQTIASLQHLNETSVIWPQTEEQWAIKEEQEKELTVGIEKLQSYVPFLEKEFQRCKKNLQRIEVDLGRIKGQEAKEKYSRAMGEAKKEYFDAVGSKDAMDAVLAKAQMVLDASRKKKFPGRSPRRRFTSTEAKPGEKPKPSQSTSTQSKPEILDEEMTGLISLGPSGQKPQ